MVNHARPLPTGDTSLPNQVVGRTTTPSRPAHEVPSPLPLAEPSSGSQDFPGPSSANPSPSVASTSYATSYASSAGSDDSGVTLMAQGTILSGNPQASPSLTGTSFASTIGSDDSGATLMAQGTILSGNQGVRDDDGEIGTSLGGSNTMDDEEGELSGSNVMNEPADTMFAGNSNNDNIQEDEVGESSTAVVDRSNNPRFQSTAAYLGLPINQVVEGAEYVDHAWHDLMKEEAPDFEAFIDNALSYPAKDLSKSAAEAFPWKDCDDDVLNKLDKSSSKLLGGFSREIPNWLDFYRQETHFYVQYIRETQALYTALKTRLNRLQQSNAALQEEREALNHRLARVHGINAIVGGTRFWFLARVNEITTTESNQQEEARQLLEQLRRCRDEFNRVVGTALQLDSENDAPELSRVEEKRKAEEKAKLEEERKLMEMMKLQSQKNVEEKTIRQHNEAKAREERKGKNKDKGKAVDKSPSPDPSHPIPFAGRSATHPVSGPPTLSGPTLSPSTTFAGQSATPSSPSSTAANADEVASLLSNLAFPQPQTLSEAARLLTPSVTAAPTPTLQPAAANPANSAPTWFPIFEAQQLVSLAGATPRARFDQLMVYNAGLYSRAEQGDQAAKQEYDAINEAMNTAMAQAHQEEVKWLRGEAKREDEEAERVRRWNRMSFEEKRRLGYY